MQKISEITHCISISAHQTVQLFHNHESSPMPLPSWVRNTLLDNKAVLHNFVRRMDDVAESKKNITDELQQINYHENPMYSAWRIRFALQLCYTSLSG